MWKQDDNGWFFRPRRAGDLEPDQVGMGSDAGLLTSEHVFVRSLQETEVYDKLVENRG